jgi:NADPH:quinone reductase-like Zn-dependent oxidoreductase
MKYTRVIISRHGGLDVLNVIEEELQEPKKGEVRVKILAASVSFTDILIREGLYPGIPKVPFTPGYDMVGIVEKLGENVSQYQLGDMVVSLTKIGGYAEFICLPENALIPVPADLDPIAVCSLPLSYVTAYQLLHRVAKVPPDKQILIHGAGGAVGIALLQLGKLLKLEMYGTASLAKHEVVMNNGGIPIDYKNQDFVTKIRHLTGDGVDVVFDGIGGDNLIRSYQSLRKDGKLVSYGFFSALSAKSCRFLRIGLTLAQVSFLQLIPDGKKAYFYSIESMKNYHPEWFIEDFNTLLNLLKEGKIKPAIGQTFPLREVRQAQELLEQKAVRGKIILICQT